MNRIAQGPRTGAAIVLALAVWLCCGAARAHDFEITGMLGTHLFSPSNELGRPDLETRDTAPQHSGAVGLNLSYAPHPRIALELEGVLLPTFTRDGQATVIGLGYRGHLLVHLLTGRFRPFLLLGGGGISSIFSSDTSVIGIDTDEAFHAGAGLKVDLTRHVGLRLDGRVLVVPRVEDDALTPEGEIFVGAYWRWGGKRKPVVVKPQADGDADGDGVPDSRDACPQKAEDADSFKDSDGCPDPDNDDDGVLDADDKCPLAPGPAGAPNRGCPDQDSDGDKIVDREDKCPAEAGVAAHGGCPPPPPPPPNPDTDGDGVLNADDRCPDQKGSAATAGCPDADSDGVADAQDKCPDKAETRNGFKDDDGCPDALPKAVARFSGVIKGINFKTGKDVILKPSFKVLLAATKVLKQFPDLRLEISGHTDNAGDRDANIALSKSRAEAVKRFLVSQGIAEGRLQAAGYGPDRPIADNRKKSGKAKNRRVEFKLLSP